MSKRFETAVGDEQQHAGQEDQQEEHHRRPQAGSEFRGDAEAKARLFSNERLELTRLGRRAGRGRRGRRCLGVIFDVAGIEPFWIDYGHA